MNDLLNYFKENTDRPQINKWHHYFDIYERHFSKFRDRPIVFLEIGVQNGGSYLMWKKYFNVDSQFYGIDIDPRCLNFEENKFKIFIGSQSNKFFLESVLSQIPDIDIIIDDGGHTMEQQIVSFEVLYPKLKNGGIYLVEDTHTSYFLSHGGGYRRRSTFIEYAKKFADVLHGFHINKNIKFIEGYKHTVKSIHFYDSIVVFEKDKVIKPFSEKIGVVTIPYQKQHNKNTLTSFVVKYINLILALLRLPALKIQDDPLR